MDFVGARKKILDHVCRPASRRIISRCFPIKSSVWISLLAGAWQRAAAGINDGGSVKIVRLGFDFGDRQGQDTFGLDGNHVVEVLQYAFNEQELFPGQEEAVLRE